MIQIFEEFKDYIATGIISIVTGLFSFFAGKRMSDAEVQKAEGSALETIQSVYDKFAADTRGKITELSSEIKILTDKVKDLSGHVIDLEKDLEDCRKLNKQ